MYTKYVSPDGKESACNAGDRVQSLGWEDPPEKEMVTHPSILVWRIPWIEKSGRLQSMALKRIWHSSSVQFSCSVVSDSATSWTAAGQTSLSITTPRAFSCPSLHWCHPTISFSVVPPSPPAFSLSQHQGLFQWVISSHQVAKVLERHLQHQSFQWIVRTISFRIVRFDLLAVQIQVLFILTWTAAVASVLCSQIHSLGFHAKWKIQFLLLSFLMPPYCLWEQILSRFIWPCLYFFSHAFYNFPLHITGLSFLLVVNLFSFTFHELCCFSYHDPGQPWLCNNIYCTVLSSSVYVFFESVSFLKTCLIWFYVSST